MRKTVLLFTGICFSLTITCICFALSKDKEYYIKLARTLPAIDKYFSENPSVMDYLVVGEAEDLLCLSLASHPDPGKAACKEKYQGMKVLQTSGITAVTVLFKDDKPVLLQPEEKYLLYEDYCQDDKECHQTCDKKGNCEMVNWYQYKPAHETFRKENVRYYCGNERCQKNETPTVSTNKISKKGKPYFIDIGTVTPGKASLLYKEFKDTKSGIMIITPSSDFDMGDYDLEHDTTIQVRFIGKGRDGISRVVYPHSLIYDIELEKKLYELQKEKVKIVDLFFSDHFEDGSGAYIQVDIAHLSPCETIETDIGKGGVSEGGIKGGKKEIMQEGQLYVSNRDYQDDEGNPAILLKTKLNGYCIEFYQENSCVSSHAQCCQQRMEETKQIIKQVFDIP